MTPAAIPPSRAWMGEVAFSVSIGEALINLSLSRASSVRLLGFFNPLDRTLSSLARRARRRRARKRKTEMAPVRRRLVAVWSGVGLSSVEKSVGARSSTGP